MILLQENTYRAVLVPCTVVVDQVRVVRVRVEVEVTVRVTAGPVGMVTAGGVLQREDATLVFFPFNLSLQTFTLWCSDGDAREE